MIDEYLSEIGQNTITLFVVAAVIIVAILFGSGGKPAGPSSVDGSYNTSIHIEDNDTTVCVGFCPKE